VHLTSASATARGVALPSVRTALLPRATCLLTPETTLLLANTPLHYAAAFADEATCNLKLLLASAGASAKALLATTNRVGYTPSARRGAAASR
jgi:hypothetical protein